MEWVTILTTAFRDAQTSTVKFSQNACKMPVALAGAGIGKSPNNLRVSGEIPRNICRPSQLFVHRAKNTKINWDQQRQRQQGVSESPEKIWQMCCEVFGKVVTSRDGQVLAPGVKTLKRTPTVVFSSPSTSQRIQLACNSATTWLYFWFRSCQLLDCLWLLAFPFYAGSFRFHVSHISCWNFQFYPLILSRWTFHVVWHSLVV